MSAVWNAVTRSGDRRTGPRDAGYRGHHAGLVARTFGLTGRQAESALRSVGVTLNRNSLPFDANGPWYTSGLRLGTPATTLSVKSGPSKAKFRLDETVADKARARVAELSQQFPLYPEIDMDIVTG